VAHERPTGARALVQGFGLACGVEAQGWSQERLAEHADLNRSYIGEIERGVVIASLLTVEKLAGALQVTSDRASTARLMAIAC
jgi:transcriptional regulator with XRE-family HTH domain